MHNNAYVEAFDWNRNAMEIKVKLIHPKAQLPVRAHSTDAAFDLFAVEETVLVPEYISRIRTGIVLELPVGVEAQIWPKSSDALRNMFVHLGTVDPGYRGEIIVLARTFSGRCLAIRPGEKIAQLKFVALTHCELSLTEHVDETERGKDGFGSTGRGPVDKDAMQAKHLSAVDLMKLPVEERRRILARAAALVEKDYALDENDFFPMEDV